jgi:hypothetical protein
MKKIKLTQGKFALVSNIDYTYLNQWKWHARKHRRTFYAGRVKYIHMHRVILERMGFVGFKETDHKDGNGLNNQRRNLRAATNSENQANCPIKKNNTSGYKGVTWDASRGKWLVQIQVNYRKIGLGRYVDKREAARIYNKSAKKYFGKFTTVNKIRG